MFLMNWVKWVVDQFLLELLFDKFGNSNDSKISYYKVLAGLHWMKQAKLSLLQQQLTSFNQLLNRT